MHKHNPHPAQIRLELPFAMNISKWFIVSVDLNWVFL